MEGSVAVNWGHLITSFPWNWPGRGQVVGSLFSPRHSLSLGRWEAGALTGTEEHARARAPGGLGWEEPP